MLVPLAVIVGIVESRRQRSVAVIAPYLHRRGAILVANVTKWLVGQARPNFDRLTGFSGPSFPSGHAVASAACLAAFALVIGRRRSRRARAVSPASRSADRHCLYSGDVGRSLADRRARRVGHGMGVVRGLLNRLWGSPAPIRRSSGGRSAGCCPRLSDQKEMRRRHNEDGVASVNANTTTSKRGFSSGVTPRIWPRRSPLAL